MVCEHSAVRLSVHRYVGNYSFFDKAVFTYYHEKSATALEFYLSGSSFCFVVVVDFNQFGSRWYRCAREGPYMLYPGSQEFSRVVFDAAPVLG